MSLIPTFPFRIELKHLGRLVLLLLIVWHVLAGKPLLAVPCEPPGSDDRSAEAARLLQKGVDSHNAIQMREALQYFSQALGIFREVRDRSGEATTLGNIGSVYHNLRQLEKALQYLKWALAIHRDVGNRSGQATTLGNIGAVYDRLEQRDKALEFYNEALPIFQEVRDLSGEATTRNNIGLLYDHVGQRGKALEYYAQAWEIRREARDQSAEANTTRNIELPYDRLNQASTLNNIGTIYYYLGQRDKALEYYNEALPIFREVKDRYNEATTLNNIGLVYDNEFGQRDNALEFFNQALRIRREVRDRWGEAITRINIGSVYDCLGQREKALEYYNHALPILLEVGGRSGEDTTLSKIGSVNDELGQREKAVECHNQGLPILREAEGRSGQAATLNNIGLVYNRLGQREKALQYYNQALPILREVGNRSGEAITLANLMLSAKSLNRAAMAVFYGKQSVNTYQSLRTDIGALENETQQTYLKTVEQTYRVLVEILIDMGRLPEAQQVMGLLKEEEYFEFVRRDAVTASQFTSRADLTPTEVAADKRYDEALDNLAAIGKEHTTLRRKKNLAALTAQEEDRLATLRKKLDEGAREFQKFLDSLVMEFGKDKVREIRDSQSQITTFLGKLEEGTVAIYTLVGEQKFSVILTTPDAPQKAYEVSVGRVELNRLIASFQESLRHTRGDPREAGRELYDVLVAPIEQDLKKAGAQTLLWSLDGSLRYVPIAALYDGNQFLVERYRNVLITLASHDRLTDQPATSWKALGFGVSEALQNFNSLPGVPEELGGIIRGEAESKEAGSMVGVVKLDKEFNRQTLTAALYAQPHYPVVHIASHFQFQPGNDADSFLLLGDGDHLTLAQIQGSYPILFEHVDLLTLSACDTATGNPSAEGKEVEGFAVLAQRQGAKAIIATLWPVADNSTMRLMRAFYENREANPHFGKAEALRKAQISLLKGNIESGNGDADLSAPYAHPFYWAPFILMGNSK